MSFNQHDLNRNACMLRGKMRTNGYDWWWHSFTAHHAVTGEERAFFIEYFLCNPDLAEDKPVFGQLESNKKSGKKPSYLMVKAGAWGSGARQIHRFFAWKDVSVHYDAPYSVLAGDCFASDYNLRGSVCVTAQEMENHPEYMCSEGSMTWDLQVEKKIAFNVGYGADKAFRTAQAFEMYWHAEGMKTDYSGEITWCGERYIVRPEDCYGYSDKNWGSGFTTPWVWLSSCNLYSSLSGNILKNSVFDIGGGKPCVLGVPLKDKLLSAFWYEGRPFEFNFSKAWTFTSTKFSCKETETHILWHVTQTSTDGQMDCYVKCRKSDMLLINYESPDGLKRHNRLWNGGNGTGKIRLFARDRKGKLYLLDEIIAKNVGCEYGEYDT